MSLAAGGSNLLGFHPSGEITEGGRVLGIPLVVAVFLSFLAMAALESGVRRQQLRKVGGEVFGEKKAAAPFDWLDHLDRKK